MSALWSVSSTSSTSLILKIGYVYNFDEFPRYDLSVHLKDGTSVLFKNIDPIEYTEYSDIEMLEQAKKQPMRIPVSIPMPSTVGRERGPSCTVM